MNELDNSQSPEDIAAVTTRSRSSETERLEVEKLQIEVHNLRKPVYKHVGFYTALFPLVTILIGALISWKSGWFDLKAQEIKNVSILREAENKLREAEGKRLLTQKETLTAENAKLGMDRHALNSEIDRLNERRQAGELSITSISNRLAQLQRQKDENEELIKGLNSEVSKLTKENQQAQLLATRVKELQVERDASEAKVQELRERLFGAHMCAYMLYTNYSEAITYSMPRENMIKEFFTKHTLQAVLIGKWRVNYDLDKSKHNLIQFIGTDADPTR